MAKIDIKYSTGDIVATSGISETRPADLSGAIDLLGGIAKRDMDRISQKEALEQAAIDSNYNANETVRLNSELYSIKEKHKQLLIDAPEKYQATVMGELSGLFNQSLDAAPSIKAKMAMTQQIAQMKIHAGISTANDASEARAVVDRSNFMDNSDKLSAQVLENPESYEVAKLQMSKLLEAFKTRAKSPEEYVRAVQFQNDRLDLVFLQGVADKSPEKALELAKSDKFSHLGADNLDKINLSAYKTIDTRLREEEKKAKEMQDAFVLDVKSRIAKSRDLSSASDMVTEVLSKQKQLGKDLPSLLNDAYSNYDHWKSKQEDVTRVATFTENGVHLSPDNPKDLKRIESVFDQHREKYNKMEVGDKAIFVKSWLDQYGVLPPSVATGLVDSVRNGSPDNKAKAAVLLNDLLDSDERIMRQFGGKHQDVALASRIARNLTYGMEPRVAVESAEMDIFKGDSLQSAKDPRRQARIKLYNEQRTPIGLGDFTSFWKDDPDTIPAEMLSEAEDYKRILVLNYGEPEDKAHEKSIIRTKANWGYTTINGELEFKRNPVEKLYGGGKDASWIRRQLETEVGKAGAMVDKTKISPTDLKLIPIPDYLAKTGTPEYLVTHPDKNGFPTPVLKKDEKKGLVPFVWKPSLVQTESYQKARGISKEKLNDMNNSANNKMLDRYRAKLIDEALKNESISPETRKKIKDDQRRAYTSKIKPNLTTEDLENLDDVKPVDLGK